MKVMPNLGYCLPEDNARELNSLLGRNSARGISLKWKNCIKHSICINYIAALINIGTLSGSGGAAGGGVGLKAALQAIILEATIHARGALQLPVMSQNK